MPILLVGGTAARRNYNQQQQEDDASQADDEFFASFSDAQGAFEVDASEGVVGGSRNLFGSDLDFLNAMRVRAYTTHSNVRSMRV